jgi:putative NADH-flavin reductase
VKVVVIGATGGIGRRLVAQALGAGHQVTAFVRDPSRVGDLGAVRIEEGDVLDLLALTRVLREQDAVLCALGAGSRRATTLYSHAARNIVAAAKELGLRRIVFVSNFGVLHERASDLGGRAMMAAAQIALRAVLADHRLALKELIHSELDWIAVRPLALTDGPRTGTYRVSESGIPAGGSRISRADVADFMLRHIVGEEYLRSIPAIAY